MTILMAHLTSVELSTVVAAFGLGWLLGGVMVAGYLKRTLRASK